VGVCVCVPYRYSLFVFGIFANSALASDPSISHVCVCHCETSSGILNPIQAIGEIVHKHKRSYFVDAMSSFGAIGIDFQQSICKLFVWFICRSMMRWMQKCDIDLFICSHRSY